ncbi:MAG: leucyl aminopeptidase [Gammaproteobacteria bacterium]|jgi:leucyl aminopeptidase|nr:leucyl aminopeptidase [Gammaproteobacteria bacterium]
MRFDVSTAKAGNLATPVALVAVFEDGQKGVAATQLAKAGLDIDPLLEHGDISGKAGEMLLITHTGGLPCERVLLVGCGKRGELDRTALRTALGSAFGWLSARPYTAAACLLTLEKISGADSFRSARIVAEVWHHSTYRFTELKSVKAEPDSKLEALTIVVRDAKAARAARKGAAEGDALGLGMSFSRRLANLPGNVCTPSYLADTARQLATGVRNLKCKVLSESEMKKLGMGSLLSVSAGSAQPAKLIVLEYTGAAKSRQPTVLVGKGVTFDTGGISLKPPATMDEMKFDMSGAASVLGTFRALAELQPKLNAVGIIPTVENMPGGSATKPGDIVTSMSGQTIEILNTDAEGRLILCDALTYAQQNYKPAALIDIATLTGACVIALGSHHAGLMSNSDTLAKRLLAAGQAADDRAWRLPLGDDYAKQLNSNFADMANIGGREAGTITAGCFLGKFVKDTDWAHLDIAGTAYQGGTNKGSSGRPVPLLLEYILNA